MKKSDTLYRIFSFFSTKNQKFGSKPAMPFPFHFRFRYQNRGTDTFTPMLRPMLKMPLRPVTGFTSAYFNRLRWFW